MSRNAPPPLLPSLLGKPQTFAMPTAEPTDARIKPQRLAKLLVFFLCSMFFSHPAVKKPHGIGARAIGFYLIPDFRGKQTPHREGTLLF